MLPFCFRVGDAVFDEMNLAHKNSADQNWLKEKEKLIWNAKFQPVTLNPPYLSMK